MYNKEKRKSYGIASNPLIIENHGRLDTVS